MDEETESTARVAPPGSRRQVRASRRAERKKGKRGGGRIVNFLLFIGIIAAIGLFAWAEQQRRAAFSQLEQTQQQLDEIQQSTNETGQAVADRVIEQVSSLYNLPTEPAPTVATIVDVERLREASEFYNRAENGDHLIITLDRAILYSPDKNLIMDVVPVSREATPTAEEATHEDEAGTPEGDSAAEDDTTTDTPATDSAENLENDTLPGN